MGKVRNECGLFLETVDRSIEIGWFGDRLKLTGLVTTDSGKSENNGGGSGMFPLKTT